jgi:hypothetical protein
MNKHTLTGLFASVALLSACGGGGSEAPAPAPVATDAVPDSASQSALGLKRYLTELGAMPVDDREPLDLSTFAPQTSEDSEPEPLS